MDRYRILSVISSNSQNEFLKTSQSQSWPDLPMNRGRRTSLPQYQMSWNWEIKTIVDEEGKLHLKIIDSQKESSHSALDVGARAHVWVNGTWNVQFLFSIQYKVFTPAHCPFTSGWEVTNLNLKASFICLQNNENLWLSASVQFSILAQQTPLPGGLWIPPSGWVYCARLPHLTHSPGGIPPSQGLPLCTVGRDQKP